MKRGAAFLDDLRHRAPGGGDHRRPRRQRLDHDQAEGLVPLDRIRAARASSPSARTSRRTSSSPMYSAFDAQRRAHDLLEVLLLGRLLHLRGDPQRDARRSRPPRSPRACPSTDASGRRSMRHRRRSRRARPRARMPWGMTRAIGTGPGERGLVARDRHEGDIRCSPAQVELLLEGDERAVRHGHDGDGRGRRLGDAPGPRACCRR